MHNPFLNRAKHKEKQPKAYWRAKHQEKKTAKDAGGFRVSGSGSGNKKGDVQLIGIARIECKATQAKSFRVTREMVEKIELAAMGSDEIPAIVIEFLNEQGQRRTDVAVIPYTELMRLLRLVSDK